MILSVKQFEAILSAMFSAENEIQHLKYLLTTTDDEQNKRFLAQHLEWRTDHYEALKSLIENNSIEGGQEND